MRGAFGLVSILVVMAIILYVIAGKSGCTGQSYLQTVTNVKKEKEPIVKQWSGRDVKGRPFPETIALEDWPESGPLKGLRVATVDPTGAAALHFGLLPGDVITAVGPHDVGGPIIDSVESGRDFLTDAFQKSFPITIRRGEQTLTLPDNNGGANTGGAVGGAGGGPGNGAVIPGLPGNGSGNVLPQGR